MNRRSFERTGVLLAGSIAAGVHAGLAPEHLGEWPPLGAAFVAAAAATAFAVVALAVRPSDRRAVHALSSLFAALIVGYVSTRVAALPPFDPEREPLDGLGVVTTTVEALGLLFALHLSQPRGGTR